MKMRPDLVLRDARREDLSEIVAIYNSAIPGGTAVADSAPATLESRAAWFEEHDPSTRPLWVMQKGAAIIAWASLQSYSPQPAFRRTAEVSLYVAEGHRGQGYGTMLLSRLVERCPDLGVEVLMGVAFGHNDATLRLNRKIGFEQWGRLPKVADMDGVLRDLVIMGIDLRGHGGRLR